MQVKREGQMLRRTAHQRSQLIGNLYIGAELDLAQIPVSYKNSSNYNIY